MPREMLVGWQKQGRILRARILWFLQIVIANRAGIMGLCQDWRRNFFGGSFRGIGSGLLKPKWPPGQGGHGETVEEGRIRPIRRSSS